MAHQQHLLQHPHLRAFLTASREYLGLSERPSAACAAPYRKVMQSFLLAVGVSSIAAGQALADDPCEAMGKSAPAATVSDKGPGKF